MEEPNAILDEVVDNFLATYRNTEHDTTGESPAKLLMGRHLRCSLDMILPPSATSAIDTKLSRKVRASQRQQKKTYDQHSKRRVFFEVGDTVLVRQPESLEKGFWKVGTVIAVLGDKYYRIYNLRIPPQEECMLIPKC